MSAPPAEPPAPAPAWLPPLVIAALAAFQLYAFHWGVVTPDTLMQWGQALSGRYDDWHPPATAWLWRRLMPLGPGTAPVLLCHLALYWSGVWLLADGLRRRGSAPAMAAVLLCAALPIPFGQLGAILKDPLLAACCLAAFGLALAAPPRLRTPAALAAGALLLFASALRFNAVFATAPLLLCWLPARWLDRPWRLIPALAGSAALLAGGGWLIDGVALRPQPSRPIFSLVNFDLAGIAAHGGTGAYPNLDRAAERRVVAACYSPGEFNPTYRPDCDAVEEALRLYSETSGRGPVAIWLGAIGRAPRAYLRHRLAHLDRNLRFLVADVPDDAIYIMATPPNPYGLSFHGNAATGFVLTAARAMARSPLGRPATWLAVALGLLAVAPALPSRRLVAAAAGSSLGYGLTYGVVSVAPDLRYNLWTMLAATIALAVAAPELRAAALPARRLLLAALPALAAVAGELATIV